MLAAGAVQEREPCDFHSDDYAVFRRPSLNANCT